jgi:nitroreductase
MLKDLVVHNRSYRRFDQSVRVSPATLHELVDLARLTPSSRNAQPLKYSIVTTPECCEKVFPQLSWAYVIMLGDTNIAKDFSIDPGIAAQTLLLGAVEKGLGGCILANIKREVLRSVLEIPAQFEILYVIALGKPVEKMVLETVGSDGEIKYWRDPQQGHHVPKRRLADLILAEK